MSNKKNDHSSNIDLVQTFVDMMNKDNLSELEYEHLDVKIKISNKTTNNNENNFRTINKNIEEVKIDDDTKNNLETPNNNHPGALNSPMVGTAYAAAEPGKDPFVKLNSSVKKGDTVLIIEAMKVMNSITAHKSGKITFIGFEDNQPVEFNQILLIIE
ncbi:acetyl-CoA carboxylase biotin carboxyl carrier protein subunit [Alphaproteobacteria bacterium]|nr:acetyl-CoA carboxylase biotin carboxyl carrier protein subunit [Alphaproteobacteria bacterium]